MPSPESPPLDTTMALEPVFTNDLVVPEVNPNTGVIAFNLDDYETPDVPPRKPRVMTPLTWSLALLLTLGAGFYGGIWVQKRNTPAGTPASAFANRNRGGATGVAGTGGAGTGQQSGGQAAAASGGQAAAVGGNTSGTIVLVDADHNAIYITDSQGSNIKVAISPSTAMKVSKATTAIGDYATGASVVVQGTADAEGTIAATSITEGVARGNRGG